MTKTTCRRHTFLVPNPAHMGFFSEGGVRSLALCFMPYVILWIVMIVKTSQLFIHRINNVPYLSKLKNSSLKSMHFSSISFTFVRADLVSISRYRRNLCHKIGASTLLLAMWNNCPSQGHMSKRWSGHSKRLDIDFSLTSWNQFITVHVTEHARDCLKLVF